MGVSHTDDMSTFLMMLLHRELNGTPLMEKEIITKLSAERKKLNGINRDVKTIKTTPIPKNGGKQIDFSQSFTKYALLRVVKQLIFWAATFVLMDDHL